MTANVETMAYRFADRRDAPWNDIGTRVENNSEVTTYEFLKRAGANWTARKEPLWMRAGVDNHAWLRQHVQTDAFALIRDDTCAVLNIVSKQYKPVQNAQIFEFFKEWCDAGEATIEAAGVLASGKIVWCLANIHVGFTLPGGDRVGGYLLFYNPHDGRAGGIKHIGLRLTCANMLNMLGAAAGFRIHHRSKFDPEYAKQTMGISREKMEKFARDCEFLSSRACPQILFGDYLRRLWPVEQNAKGEVIIPRMHEKARAGWYAEQQAMLADTWWRAYNAVTYAIDHDKSRSDKAKLLNSNWFGAGEKVKVRALEIALEMAK